MSQLPVHSPKPFTAQLGSGELLLRIICCRSVEDPVSAEVLISWCQSGCAGHAMQKCHLAPNRARRPLRCRPGPLCCYTKQCTPRKVVALLSADRVQGLTQGLMALSGASQARRDLIHIHTESQTTKHSQEITEPCASYVGLHLRCRPPESLSAPRHQQEGQG